MAKAKREKKEKKIEPFWQELVGVYFDFTKANSTIFPALMVLLLEI
jgi:hypothetical protein